MIFANAIKFWRRPSTSMGCGCAYSSRCFRMVSLSNHEGIISAGDHPTHLEGAASGDWGLYRLSGFKHRKRFKPPDKDLAGPRGALRLPTIEFTKLQPFSTHEGTYPEAVAFPQRRHRSFCRKCLCHPKPLQGSSSSSSRLSFSCLRWHHRHTEPFGTSIQVTHTMICAF